MVTKTSQYDRFYKAVNNGDAYRVSKRQTLDDGQEFIVHFDPQSAGGTIHIEPPAIEAPQRANIDVYENADPGDSTNTDLFVHNMRYDGQESPEATVVRVDNGGLDTTGDADQTEQSLVRSNSQFNTPAGSQARAIWRTIPVGETISMVITDQSGGAGNEYSFDTVIYEGETLER